MKRKIGVEEKKLTQGQTGSEMTLILKLVMAAASCLSHFESMRASIRVCEALNLIVSIQSVGVRKSYAML